MSATYTGVVRWFNASKGFGFIGKGPNTTDWFDESGSDIFVHYTCIVADGYKTLSEGSNVEFSVIEGSKGRLQAEHVTVV